MNYVRSNRTVFLELEPSLIFGYTSEADDSVLISEVSDVEICIYLELG